MGWAARAKQAKGNPTRTTTSVRFLKESALRQAFFHGKQRVRVDYSDRAYLVDTLTGQLRRAPVASTSGDA